MASIRNVVELTKIYIENYIVINKLKQNTHILSRNQLKGWFDRSDIEVPAFFGSHHPDSSQDFPPACTAFLSTQSMKIFYFNYFQTKAQAKLPIDYFSNDKKINVFLLRTREIALLPSALSHFIFPVFESVTLCGTGKFWIAAFLFLFFIRYDLIWNVRVGTECFEHFLT